MTGRSNYIQVIPREATSDVIWMAQHGWKLFRKRFILVHHLACIETREEYQGLHYYVYIDILSFCCLLHYDYLVLFSAKWPYMELRVGEWNAQIWDRRVFMFYVVRDSLVLIDVESTTQRYPCLVCMCDVSFPNFIRYFLWFRFLNKEK